MNARSLLLSLLLLLRMRLSSRIVLKLGKVNPKPFEKVRMLAYQFEYLSTTPISCFLVNAVAQIQRVRTYFREHMSG